MARQGVCSKQAQRITSGLPENFPRVVDIEKTYTPCPTPRMSLEKPSSYVVDVSTRWKILTAAQFIANSSPIGNVPAAKRIHVGTAELRNRRTPTLIKIGGE
jgi:hypothetical protein